MHNYHHNFDYPSALSDGDNYNLTGVTKGQFDALVSYLKLLRDSNNRSTRTYLALLLTKLKTGNFLSIWGSMFEIKQIKV